MLEEILHFWIGAHSELIPGKGAGGVTSQRSIGVNMTALSFIAGDDILKVLHEWEKIIRQERNLTPPALIAKPEHIGIEVRQAIQFAQSHLRWSAMTDWAHDYLAEIKQLHQQGRAAAKSFLDPIKRISCPGEVEGQRCNYQIALKSDDAKAIIYCRKCDTEWTAIRLVAVALSDPNQVFWLDAEAIGQWLGVSARHIRRVAKESAVAKRGSLYDMKAVAKAMGVGI